MAFCFPPSLMVKKFYTLVGVQHAVVNTITPFHLNSMNSVHTLKKKKLLTQSKKKRGGLI